jgi:hypothetical protein
MGPVLRQGYVPAKHGRNMKSRKTRPKWDPFYDRVRFEQNRS